MATATTTNVTTMEMEPRSTRIRLAVHPTGQESRKRAGILLKKDGGTDHTRSRTEEDPGDSPMRAASRCSPGLERPLWSLSSAAPAAPEEEGVESLLVVAARRGLMPARRGLIPARSGAKKSRVAGWADTEKMDAAKGERPMTYDNIGKGMRLTAFQEMVPRGELVLT